MAETTTTTEWKSAFALNPPDTSTGEYQTIALHDGVYYWVVSAQQPKQLTSDTFGGLNGIHSNYYYDGSTVSWVEIEDDQLPFFQVVDGLYWIIYPKSSIVAQSWDRKDLKSTYYTRNQFDSRFVPAPVGNVFDSIYTVDALGGILSVLPVVLAALLGYIAVRKGLRFVSGLLERG